MSLIDPELLSILKRLTEDHHDLHVVVDREEKPIDYYTTPTCGRKIKTHSELKLKINQVDFDGLHKNGFIYLDAVDFDVEKILIYRPTVTARLILSAEGRVPENKPSKTMLNVLSKMYEGHHLHMEEINGDNEKTHIRVDNIRLIITTFGALIRDSWIEPARQPTQPPDNLRSWYSTWKLTNKGKQTASASFHEERQPMTTMQYTHASLAKDIIELLDQNLRENPELQDVFNIDDVLNHIRFIFMKERDTKKPPE